MTITPINRTQTTVLNQLHLHFQKKLRQRRHWNEACVLKKDTPLNKVLANVIVDQWQHNINSFSQPSQDKPEDEFHENGPQESLTTEVEKRFVKALIMRTREADYVPLTNNLGLNHKRRTLYFPMDSDYLNLDDGLVDTGVLSSAIQETNLPKIRWLAPQSNIKEVPASNFQKMVSNGKLENPKRTLALKFELGDFNFHEIVTAMEKHHVLSWSFKPPRKLYHLGHESRRRYTFLCFQCNWKPKITNTQTLWNLCVQERT